MGHDSRRHERLCKLHRLETWLRRLDRIAALVLCGGSFFGSHTRISARGQKVGIVFRNAKHQSAFRGYGALQHLS